MPRWLRAPPRRWEDRARPTRVPTWLADAIASAERPPARSPIVGRRRDPFWRDLDAVLGHHLAVDAQAMLGVFARFRAADESDPVVPVDFEQVRDEIAEPLVAVDEHARTIGKLDRDADARQGCVATCEVRERFVTERALERAGYEDEAVEPFGAHEIEERARIRLVSVRLIRSSCAEADHVEVSLAHQVGDGRGDAHRRRIAEPRHQDSDGGRGHRDSRLTNVTSVLFRPPRLSKSSSSMPRRSAPTRKPCGSLRVTSRWPRP